MANREQLALILQSVKSWNSFRRDKPDQRINLSRANLSEADLRGANVSKADLTETNVSECKLGFADLSHADLSRANLFFANLQNANLSEANLYSADLNAAYAMGVNLHKACLIDANLGESNLRKADLSSANLFRARVLYTDFTQATLTGACIANCYIGDTTQLDGICCHYIFRTIEGKGFSGRLPVDPNSTFAPGEFTQRFQILASALETIDITFTEGIDWKAFFQSFQDLRNQRPDENISIQGMERKGEAFVVRLEVDQEADKAKIETQVKQLYANQLAALEAQYAERLQLQGIQIEDAKQTIEVERKEKATLMGIMATMAENQGPKYDQRGAQFAGGFAETVKGNQIGGVVNNYSQNADDILRLLAALREMTQRFPAEQKDEAQMELDDLEADLKKPDKQEPKRLGKRLKRLMAAGTAAATIAGGAVTFSGNINEFTDNVLELGEKIGLSREDVQSSQP